MPVSSRKISLLISFHALPRYLLFKCAKKAVVESELPVALINISSVHGLVASANKSAYVSAKHGVVGLTKAIALECATDGITVNAICPGWVRTPLVEAQIHDRSEVSSRSFEEEASILIQERQPNRTFVTPEQIGSLCLYLMSEAAASVTGMAVPIDGAWTAH